MVTIKKKRLIFTLTENYFGYKFKLSDLLLPACYNGLRKAVTDPFFLGAKVHSQTTVLFLDKPVGAVGWNNQKTKKHSAQSQPSNAVLFKVSG